MMGNIPKLIPSTDWYADCYLYSGPTLPLHRLESTPEFEACASDDQHGHHSKGAGHPNGKGKGEGMDTTGPTFSWAGSASTSTSTSLLSGRGRGDDKKTTAEARLEERMGAAVSKVGVYRSGPAFREKLSL